ncbi:MAG: Rieske (2Fe-2S) protein [Candidatus Omnitrophica bacterium]|nr:Rieske (2Fe-2S) protein [Candidatus Omnitrophota bacterium]
MKTPVSKFAEVPPGTSCLVKVGSDEVALFNVEGRFYAIGNRCPHRSGPLSRGKVERVSSASGAGAQTLAVRCPVHGWLFDLASGRCLTRSSASTPSYPVTCEGEEIFLG